MTTDAGWRAALDQHPRLVQRFRLEPRKAALLVIDLQNVNANPEHGYGAYLKAKFPQHHAYLYGRLAEVAIPNVQRLLAFCRQQGLRVIYSTVGPALADWSDLSPLLRIETAAGYRGLWGLPGSYTQEVLAAVAPQPGELVLNKTTTGVFASTGLDSILRSMRIEQLLFTGMATSACVQSTLREAADRGYRCVLVEDGCVSDGQQLHEASLQMISVQFGFVKSTDEVLAELTAALDAPSAPAEPALRP